MLLCWTVLVRLVGICPLQPVTGAGKGNPRIFFFYPLPHISEGLAFSKMLTAVLVFLTRSLTKGEIGS